MASSLTFDFMYRDKVATHVVITDGVVTFENKLDIHPVCLAFGVLTSATYKDVMDLFEERCFPEERYNAKELLRQLDVDWYEPEFIVKKTHGLQYDDYNWIRFEGEDIDWNDIKLRD